MHILIYILGSQYITREYAILWIILAFILGASLTFLALSKTLSERRNLKRALREYTSEITQQKEELSTQTEQLDTVYTELKQLSLIARESDNAVAILDPKGVLLWMNKQFMHIQEFTSRESLVGLNLIQVSTNPHLKWVIRRIVKDKKSESYEILRIIKRKRIWMQMTLTPVLNENNDIQSIILIGSDISKHKEDHEKITIQKQRILSQKEMLEQANTTKNRFFQIIASDLRSPIATMVSTIDVLHDTVDTLTPDKLNYYLTEMKQLTGLTYSLVENLLQWSKCQDNSITFEPNLLNLSEVVLDVLYVISPLASRKKIKINNELPEKLQAWFDEDMIKVVMRNLISNAIKFTPRHGNIYIQAETIGSGISVLVKDTGVGIEAQNIEHLFVAGKNISTRGTENEKGSGLGLILSSEFINKHGSQFQVDSTPNEGSCFSFTLPVTVKKQPSRKIDGSYVEES